jgi:chemotaxis protein MotB
MAKKKRKIDDEKGVDIGLVLTISVFLILLTFFILLNSIAVIDDRKARLAIGSLVGAFGSFHGGLSPIRTGAADRVVPISAPMIDDTLTINDLLSLMDQDLSGQIKVESSKEQDKIILSEDFLFDGNQGIPKASSFPVLNKICSFIKKGKYPVEIIGHTDNRPAEEKGHRSNWELSSSMALKVLKYFLKEGKISPKRLCAHGAADCRPIASNETRESRKQNRRIEIILDFKAATYVKRIYRKRPSGIFTYKRFNFKIFE